MRRFFCLQLIYKVLIENQSHYVLDNQLRMCLNKAMNDATLLKGDDFEPDALAESGLELINTGKSLDQAASELGVTKTTLVRHFLRNNTYELRYARAMVSKGVIYADDIVSIPDSLPDDPTSGELAKAKMRMEARQWAATKFWQHLNPEKVAQAGLTQVNIQGQEGSRIVIQTAQPVNNPNDNQLGDSADGDVIEIES